MEDMHIIGSYARGTMIDTGPDKDFDVMYVLDHGVHGGWLTQESGASHALAKVRSALMADPAYPAESVTVDQNAVRVSTPNGKVEIVPAFRNPDGGYLIPDTYDTTQWRRSDPRRFKRTIDAMDVAQKGRFIQLVRICKNWNNVRKLGLRSFHLETMVYDFFRTRKDAPDNSLPGVLHEFFERLPWYVQNSSYEPVYSEKVDRYLAPTDRDRIIRSVQRTRRHLLEAEGRLTRHGD